MGLLFSMLPVYMITPLEKIIASAVVALVMMSFVTIPALLNSIHGFSVDLDFVIVYDLSVFIIASVACVISIVTEEDTQNYFDSTMDDFRERDKDD